MNSAAGAAVGTELKSKKPAGVSAAAKPAGSGAGGAGAGAGAVAGAGVAAGAVAAVAGAGAGASLPQSRASSESPVSWSSSKGSEKSNKSGKSDKSGKPDSVPAQWTLASAMHTSFTTHKLDVVVATLTRAIDYERNPAAVDWCLHMGVKMGAVPMLYKSARNAMKWTKWGRVPTTDEMTHGLMLCLLLLVRVAQDVQTCVSDLGRMDRAFVFRAFHDKVRTWLEPWGQDTLSRAMPAAGHLLQEWLTERNLSGEPLPNPAWATAFSVPMLLGTTFTFGCPAPEDVAAFERCRTLWVTRQEVAGRVQDLIAICPDYTAMLTGFTNLVVVSVA